MGPGREPFPGREGSSHWGEYERKGWEMMRWHVAGHIALEGGWEVGCRRIRLDLGWTGKHCEYELYLGNKRPIKMLKIEAMLPDLLN